MSMTADLPEIFFRLAIETGKARLNRSTHDVEEASKEGNSKHRILVL